MLLTSSVPDETIWCDACPDFRAAEFAVFPDNGHPGDYGYACLQHVGDVMLSCLTPGLMIDLWAVQRVGDHGNPLGGPQGPKGLGRSAGNREDQEAEEDSA